MNIRFAIEDELHAEEHSFHQTLNEAIVELKRLALIPWDKEPNVAPCTNCKKCGRHYEIIEYDTSSEPWRELRRMLALKISAEGVIWADEFRE